MSTPRWTWQTVLLAAGLTVGVFLLLPYLELWSQPTTPALNLRNIDTATLPPPAEPPPETRSIRRRAPEPDIPKPELQAATPRLVPPGTTLQMDMSLHDVGGDFALDLGVSPEALLDEVRGMVFDLGDLDEPPRPLVQLKPLYPAHARLRRLEGVVELEFIVRPDGTTDRVEVVASSPQAVFARSAVRAVKRWRFKPGIRNGKPVSVRVRQKVSFRLEE